MRVWLLGAVLGLALLSPGHSTAQTGIEFAQLTQAEIRQREFIARELERQRAEDRARYAALERENGELRAMIQQIADRVSSPAPTTTTAEARENAEEARFAAAALLIDGSEQEREAARLIAAGDVRGGFAMLEAAATQETDSAVDRWRRLGVLAFEADVGLALRAYTQVVRLDPVDVESRARLAMLQMRTGDLAGARVSAEAAVANAVLDADKAMAFQALGAVQMMEGDHAGSMETLTLSLEAAEREHAANPSTATLTLLLNARMQRMIASTNQLDLALMEEDFLALEALLESPLLQVEGDSVEAQLLQDDIASLRMLPLMRTGDMDGALTILAASVERLTALKQASPESFLIDMRLWDRYTGLGNIYLMQGDGPAAIAALDQAEQIARAFAATDPNDMAKQLMWAGSALQSASTRLMTGDALAARTAIEEVDARLFMLSQQNPDNSQLQLMRAMSLAFIGLIDLSIQQEGGVPSRDPVETVREARALAAPHREAGRAPPMLELIFNLVDMLMPPESE